MERSWGCPKLQEENHKIEKTKTIRGAKGI